MYDFLNEKYHIVRDSKLITYTITWVVALVLYLVKIGRHRFVEDHREASVMEAD